MDGPFYCDTRPPHNYASPTAVTLTTAYQAIAPVGFYPVLGANYFNWVGKAIRVRLYGQFTTGATPGNITWGFLWGTGASANGTLCGGVTFAGPVSVTNNGWFIDQVFRCRSVGPTGTIFPSGFVECQGIGIGCSPPNNPAAVTLDLTQNWIFSFQSLRTGSTAETMQIHDMVLEALN